MLKEKENEFKRMFFDIETSPNIGFFWRTGYKLNINHDNIIKERAIICICWKWEGKAKVNYLTWDKDQCDKKMLEEFIKEAEKASEIVAHNGDRFDIRWIRTRCLYHRIPCMPDFKTLDTLKHARSGFNFNSNKLDYIAKFLGLNGKMETGGFELWKDIILDNNKKALRKMVDYCKKDVTLLEEVYEELYSYIKHKTHIAVQMGGKKSDCPECTSTKVQSRGYIISAAGGRKRRLQCQECSKWWSIPDNQYIKEKNAIIN